MRLSIPTFGLLVSVLIITAPTPASGTWGHFLARQTADPDACTSSISALVTSAPKPTDLALSSWLADYSPPNTYVPDSLLNAFCTYDVSLVGWVSKSVILFVSQCSRAVESGKVMPFSAIARNLATVNTLCTNNAAAAPTPTTDGVGSSQTTNPSRHTQTVNNVAGPMETGYSTIIAFAIGIVAAISWNDVDRRQ